MDDCHLGSKIRQVMRFLYRCVAAADHDQLLVAIEKSVTGRAGRDTESIECPFRGKAKPTGLGSRCDDERIGDVRVAGVTLESERASERSTEVMISYTTSVPTFSACCRICSMSQGP